jgi:hypothetical protein
MAGVYAPPSGRIAAWGRSGASALRRRSLDTELHGRSGRIILILTKDGQTAGQTNCGARMVEHGERAFRA